WQADGVIQHSTWDRLGQYEVELQRVGVAEARQIVQAYLQLVQEQFLSLGPVKGLVQKDYLFPLGERWARECLAGKTDVRPRDGDNLAGLIRALLERCAGVPPYRLVKVGRPAPPKHGQRPSVDLELRQQFGALDKELQTGVLCLAIGNRTALAAHLRRLVHSS